MKILIIYFSHTGNTAASARFISQLLRAQGHRVDEHILMASRRFSVAIDAFLAVLGKGKALKSFDCEPGKYDAIFIGSPVWAGSCPPLIISLLNRIPLISGKKVFFFLTYSKFPGRVKKQVQKKLREKGADEVLFLSLQTWGGVDSKVRAQMRNWLDEVGKALGKK